MKIKREDVIFDPTDPRVIDLMGEEVWSFNRYNGIDAEKRVLKDISGDAVIPFQCDNRKCAFIAKIKEPSYAERQAQWVEENKLRSGMIVRVTRGWMPDEFGFNFLQNAVRVGSNYQVDEVQENCIRTRNGFKLPFFAIEIVKLRPHNGYELNELVGTVLVHKKTGNRRVVLKRLEISSGHGVVVGGGNALSAEELLEMYEHVNGSPCGVLNV